MFNTIVTESFYGIYSDFIESDNKSPVCKRIKRRIHPSDTEKNSINAGKFEPKLYKTRSDIL